MKIKAMVDGIEREVELTDVQVASAYETLQRHYDGLDYDNNLSLFLEFVYGDDARMEQLIKHMEEARDAVITSYRSTMNNSSDEWFFTMRSAVEEEAVRFMESTVETA